MSKPEEKKGDSDEKKPLELHITLLNGREFTFTARGTIKKGAGLLALGTAAYFLSDWIGGILQKIMGVGG